jgi:hypothetical protein
MERLVPLGLSPTLLTEIEEVERFERAARAHRQVKAALATERAGIAAAPTEGTRALQCLRVIVTNTFARNPVRAVPVFLLERPTSGAEGGQPVSGLDLVEETLRSALAPVSLSEARRPAESKPLVSPESRRTSSSRRTAPG